MANNCHSFPLENYKLHGIRYKHFICCCFYGLHLSKERSKIKLKRKIYLKDLKLDFANKSLEANIWIQISCHISEVFQLGVHFLDKILLLAIIGFMGFWMNSMVLQLPEQLNSFR